MKWVAVIVSILALAFASVGTVWSAADETASCCCAGCDIPAKASDCGCPVAAVCAKCPLIAALAPSPAFIFLSGSPARFGESAQFAPVRCEAPPAPPPKSAA